MNLLAVSPDLFFTSRIEALVTRQGHRAVVARSAAELDERLATERPDLVLVDLGGRGLDAATTIRSAKAAGVARVIAFGPHKDLAARARALEAGADQWITNQRLLETLAELLAARDEELD